MSLASAAPAASPAPASSAADERADQLIVIATRLVGLVRAEIDALKSRRLDGGSIDFAEKERLAHAWRLEVNQVRANPSLLAGATAARKGALRDISRELETVLEGHTQALDAMKTVTEGLVRAIADEVASSRRAPAGYGRSGAMQGAKTDAASGIAVNAKA
jgi:hypothetical protein